MARLVQEQAAGAARLALRAATIAASIGEGDHSPETLRDCIDTMGASQARIIAIRTHLENTTRIRRLR